MLRSRHQKVYIPPSHLSDYYDILQDLLVATAPVENGSYDSPREGVSRMSDVSKVMDHHLRPGQSARIMKVEPKPGMF